MCAAVLAVALGLYYLLPGLGIVFGVVAPAFAIVGYVWQTGVLPRASADAVPLPPSRDGAGATTDLSKETSRV